MSGTQSVYLLRKIYINKLYIYNKSSLKYGKHGPKLLHKKAAENKCDHKYK